MPLRRLSVVLGLLAPVAGLAAQTPDSVPQTIGAIRPSAPRPIRWWHAAIAVGGVAAISLADDDLQRWVMDHRTEGEQHLADRWQEWGGGTLPVGITLGTLGAGVILRKPEVTRTGGRLATSLIAVTLLGRGMKKVIGRARPSEATDQYTFDPFSSYNALPSGHTITAFALSTTLADAIDNKWADVGLYTLAGGTAAARIVGNHHWLSDVVGGAVLGTTVAKVVDGKWRLFGLQPPELLIGGHGAGFKWTVDAPALRRSR